jgi:hypothetical protein
VTLPVLLPQLLDPQILLGDERANTVSGSASQAAGQSSTQSSTPSDTQATRSTKTSLAFAELLNSSSPQTQHRAYPDPDNRKRRRIDTQPLRTLPKPSQLGNKGSKRQRALLPPTLPPLHNPPADAGIIPSISYHRLENIWGLRESELPALGLPTLAEKERDRDVPALPDDEANERQDEHLSPFKQTKKKRKWTEEETTHLLQGVARFGIGSWKKILRHADYKFNDRTAVDLKDRFRTCCPAEYKNSGSGRGTVESILDDSVAATSSRQTSRKGPDELAKIGIQGPFPKRVRRQRREFTQAEDESLLRGFLQYGAQWKKIQMDPTLGLEHRNRTDLRDRFRNRYPHRFKEAGHTHTAKLSKQVSKEPSAEDTLLREQASQSKDRTANIPRLEDLYLTYTNSDTMEPPPSSARDDAQHPLRLLTSSLNDPYVDFATLDADDEAEPVVTLSRSILHWTDPNRVLKDPNQLMKDSQQNALDFDETQTLSRLDQFHINPLVAQQKLMPFNLQGNASTLPLSKILNQPENGEESADVYGRNDL